MDEVYLRATIQRKRNQEMRNKIYYDDAIKLIAGIMESQAIERGVNTSKEVVFDEEEVLDICMNLLENLRMVTNEG